jgi:mannosyl-3-phosphoglycerate phosphatase
MSRCLVFTDLDGTFLNHDDYSYADALPAVQALRQHDIPIIFTSSKTLPEIQQLSNELGFQYPVIYETGCGVSWPASYFSHLDTKHHDFCTPYDRVIDILDSARSQYEFQFTGFHDMTEQQVADLTGLSMVDAANARRRQFGEPLQWQDSDDNLKAFTILIKEAGLHLIAGGRFMHVMSPVDKSHAINWLVQQYQQMEPMNSLVTVGLGDSPNDVQLLKTVDHPYLVRNLHLSSEQEELAKIHGVSQTIKCGAAGWNEAIMAFLNDHRD